MGVVYEALVDLLPTKHRPALALRRVGLVLNTPTSDGDTEIRLLTTLPTSPRATAAASALAALVYKGRFGRLEAALTSEVKTSGQPRAALLAFGPAVVVYDSLAVIQAATPRRTTST